MKTPTKFNGPALNKALLWSYMRTLNYRAIDDMHKPNVILDNIGYAVVMALLVYLAAR